MDKNSPGMFYIGIDPGVSGGLAILERSGQIVDATKMPATERDVRDWLQKRRPWFGNAEQRAFCVIERVNAGVFAVAGRRMGVVSAFTFGRSYGTLLGLLTGCEIPFEEVSPRRWQAALSCLTGGDKNVSKRKAQQLYPHFSVTHAIADALLLAEYARRFQLGLFTQPPAKRGTHGEEGRTENRESQNSREAEEGREADEAHAARRQRLGQEGRSKETAGAAQSRAARHGARSVSRA